MGGITSALTAYGTTEGDEEDKKNAALKQGGLTAAGSAIGAATAFIPGVGPALSAFLTPALGEVGNYIGGLLAKKDREEKYAEENAAKKRAEEGERNL
jgi:hypothetical protein